MRSPFRRPDQRRLTLFAVAALVAATGCGSSDGAGSGATGGEPDPDRVGPQGRVAQFVVHCELSHISFDDPIVHPGRTGASHQHQFFGNTSIDADSEYDEARRADTSCDQRLDTAAYWSPMLIDADGRRQEPMAMTGYYRPAPGIDPADVVAYPAGLMMIAGDAEATSPQSTDVVAWGCGSGAVRVSEPPSCSPDSTLRLWLTFPDCWDGSTPDGYAGGERVRYSDGECPTSHPITMPQLLLAIDFPPIDPEGASLSSGPLHTAHADFWNTWDQDKLEREVAVCLNRDLVCGLGSG